MPIVVSPMYDRCGTLLPSPIVEFFVSTNVPILPFVAEVGAGAQVGERADASRRRR